MKIKKIIAMCLLAVAVLNSAFSFQVSAAQTYETRRAQYEDEAHGVTTDSYLRFYYDTSDVSHITKAYAYSTYDGSTSNPLTTESVYIVNEVKAVGTNRVTYTRKVMTGNFYLTNVSHLDESSMSANMLNFGSTVTVNTLRSINYLVVFDISGSHLSSSDCPLESETVLAKVSAIK